MSFNNYDRATRPRVANEDLEQAKFLLTELSRIAVRIGNESGTPLFTAQSNNFVIEEVEVSSTNAIEISLPENLKGIIIKPRKISRFSLSKSESGPKVTYGKGSYFEAFGLNLDNTTSIFIKEESGNNTLEVIKFI